MPAEKSPSGTVDIPRGPTRRLFVRRLGQLPSTPPPTSRAVMLIARRHAAVPRALQLRVALDDWDRNDVDERVRA